MASAKRAASAAIVCSALSGSDVTRVQLTFGSLAGLLEQERPVLFGGH